MVSLALQKNNVHYSLQKPITIVQKPQPIIQMKLAGQAVRVTSTATPTIAQSQSLSAALINTFTTRWGVVFREFLVLKIVCTIKALAGHEGTTAVYMDEISTTAPTAASAGQNTHLLLTNAVGYDNSTGVLSWTLAEINDASWTVTTGAAPVPVSLKIYSDSTTYGLVDPSADLFIVDYMLTVAFRGII